MNLITQGLGPTNEVVYLEIHSPSVEEVTFSVTVEEVSFVVEDPAEIIFIVE